MEVEATQREDYANGDAEPARVFGVRLALVFAWASAGLAAAAVFVPYLLVPFAFSSIPVSLLSAMFDPVLPRTRSVALFVIGVAIAIALALSAVWIDRKPRYSRWTSIVAGAVLSLLGFGGVGFTLVMAPLPISAAPSWAFTLWLGAGLTALGAGVFGHRERLGLEVDAWQYAVAAGMIGVCMALGVFGALVWDTNTAEFAAVRWAQERDSDNALELLGKRAGVSKAQVTFERVDVVRSSSGAKGTSVVTLALAGSARSENRQVRSVNAEVDVMCAKATATWPRFSVWNAPGAAR